MKLAGMPILLAIKSRCHRWDRSLDSNQEHTEFRLRCSNQLSYSGNVLTLRLTSLEPYPGLEPGTTAWKAVMFVHYTNRT